MQNSDKKFRMKSPERIHRTRWQMTKRLTICLLASWFLLNFGFLYFARELASFTFFDWPLSFYMAAQGLTLLYVVILGIFSICSRRIEDLSLQAERDKREDDRKDEN